MPQPHEIRRREDGSIDIPFYRACGLAERRAVIKGVATGLLRIAPPTALLVTAMAAFVLAGTTLV